MMGQVNSVEHKLKQLILDYIGLYTVDNVAGNYINGQPNFVARNALRGTAWYLIEETEKEIFTSNSNFRRQDLAVLVDDVFFNSLVSSGVEIFQIAPIVNDVLGKAAPSSVNTGVLATALILNGSRMLSEKLPFSHPVKRISQYLKHLF